MGITLCDRADVCCCLEGINIRSLLWRCCSRAAPPEPPRTKSRGRVDLPHALLYLDWLFFCLLQKPKDCVRENILYLPLGVWNSHWAPFKPGSGPWNLLGRSTSINMWISAGDMNSGFDSVEKFLKEVEHESLWDIHHQAQHVNAT